MSTAPLTAPLRTAARQPTSPGRISGQQPLRRQDWAGRSPQDILASYVPGKAEPLKVSEVLIELHNNRHTSLQKTVSHKTRQERARFLRRFFADIVGKAGFRRPPDPRNLGQKHIHAMVQVWQREKLAPATIQTYLSFLRGLGSWMGKHGFVRKPESYGLSLDEYQRHEYAQRDKSWAAKGIDVPAVLAEVALFDPRVAASMRLMDTLGLRRKESVMHRPYAHVRPFDATGLPEDKKRADEYVWVKGKGGRVRWIPLETELQRAGLCVGEVRLHQGRARRHGPRTAARPSARPLSNGHGGTTTGARRRCGRTGPGTGGAAHRLCPSRAFKTEGGWSVFRSVRGYAQ